MEITLFIRGQKLEAHYPPLYSGSVGVLYARFAEIDFDKTLVKAVRFKTADSDWYTADIADGAVRVPHEVIVSGGFDIALAGYENADGKLARFLPTNSVHINVEENGYGDPDAPIESEGEPASYTAKIEKLTSDAAAKADAAMTELEKKANAAEVYDKDTADALLGGKVDKESNAALSTVRSVSVEESPSQASTLTVAYQNGSSKTASYCTPSLTDKLLAELKEKSVPHKTVSGCPVTLTDALAGERLRECRIYGNAAGVGDVDGDVYKIPLRLRGQNLFDKSKSELYAIRNETAVQAWGTPAFNNATVKKMLRPGATYTVTYTAEFVNLPGNEYAYSSTYNWIGFSLYDDISKKTVIFFDKITQKPVNGDVLRITKTFTTPESLNSDTNNWKIMTYTAIYLNENDRSYGMVKFKDIQITEGTTAPDYEPYSEQLQEATLASPLSDGEYIDVINKKQYASDGTATDITVEGELKTAESGSLTIDCITQVQPQRMEAEYWQDINKAL